MAFEENEVFKAYSNVSLSIGSVKPLLSLNLINKIRKSRSNLLIIEGAISNLTSWYFILFKRILRIKIVAWACGWQPQIHSGLISKIKRCYERAFFNNIDWIISYSSTTEKYYRQIGIKTGITVAYNGIDTNAYYENKQFVMKSAELLKPARGEVIFLYVGGIFKDKKVDFLIDCFSQFNSTHHNARLWIIGDGPDKEELEKDIIRRKINNIVFLGRKEIDVDQYFAAVDFFILPGVGGLALNQAMLWGTPCIVSEADGTENDLVTEGETGFRFIKDDKNSLIEAMKKAISMSKEQKNMLSHKAQTLVLERSNTDQMVNTFYTVIAMLISVI
jgi:glycosyltransferase involved in cell wall biosynthesis